MTIVVRDNAERNRYELVRDGELIGRLDYQKSHDTLALLHAEVLPEVEGNGYGTRLVHDAFEDIRARGLRAVAVCPFVRDFVQQHPEYGDVVAV